MTGFSFWGEFVHAIALVFYLCDRQYLTFPLLMIKNVSPLAPCLIMYSPSL